MNYFPTLQVTQINSKPFVFKKSGNVDYPVAPSVSAKFYDVKGVQILKVRATLYIDSRVDACPKMQIPVESGSDLKLFFDYDFIEERPKSCNVWYVEFDYTSKTVSDITTIVSYLKDVDPEISRGTKTQI